MKNKNILIKKIIILFIILLTPILSIGIYSIKKANYKLQDTILSSIHSNNMTYIFQLDNVLKQIYFSNISLLNQSFVSHLAYLSPFMSKYEESILINLLREQLSTICNTQPFVESVQIFFKNTNRIYNSQGYPLGSFLQIDKEYNILLNNLQKNPSSIHYYNNPLTYTKNLAIFLTPSPSNLDYGMIINLSQKEIKDYLESNIAYLNDYYILNLNTDYTLTNLPHNLSIENLDFLLSLQNEDNLEPYFLVYLDNSPYYVFCYPLSYSKGQYIRFISANNFSNPLKLNTLLLNLLFIIVSITCIIFFIVIYQLVHKPLRQLTEAFIELEQGNFNIQINVSKPLDFTYLFSAFNNMTIQLKRLIEKNYNQKILLQKSELKQLQSQINPHFLYNSFFMLQRMIKMNLSEEALQVSNALGIYFKYITRNSMDYVTLYEEYEHTKTYAYIQGLRFEGRIDIVFETLPSDCTSIKVPKLILQPIVENAFNHGLSNTLENGLLKVHFRNSNDNVKIIIEDNGQGLSDVELLQLQSKLLSLNDYTDNFETTGLLNIQKRLIIFSNNLNGLTILHSDLGGLCIIITLSKI